MLFETAIGAAVSAGTFLWVEFLVDKPTGGLSQSQARGIGKAAFYAGLLSAFPLAFFHLSKSIAERDGMNSWEVLFYENVPETLTTLAGGALGAAVGALFCYATSRLRDSR